MSTKLGEDQFDLYQVEHVFWFKGGNPYGATSTMSEPIPKIVSGTINTVQSGLSQFDSFVPPVVAFLPQIAISDEQMELVVKQTGTSLPHQFEKSIDAAFTLLGYETRRLGQGKGRVPDGFARAIDDNYGILWDGKIRTNGYSIGTDDRTIKEYITTQAREQKRNGRLRNIYYVIISSFFSDDYTELIRSLKMETDINEVILIEATALVAMVDKKLRQPIQITLGPDGMQRHFTNSCVLTAEMVIEELS